MKPKRITQAEKQRVFIVDAQPIVRHGIKQLINNEPDLIACGEASDGDRTSDRIHAARPDIVLLDVTFHKADGLELIKQLRTVTPKLPVLVFAAHEESLYAARALRAGAKGYLRKRAETAELLEAIRCVLNGQVYLTETVRKNLLIACANGDHPRGSAVHKLSDRELEVFRLLGKGHSTRRIATEMHLSVSTIETYRANIKNKLDLDSPGELLKHAIQWLHLESSA